jgi:hypothetical protein
MGISRAALVFGSSAVALVVTMASCLDPTQITVDIATDVKCVDTKGTAIAGGTPGTLELASPTTSTRDCDNGHVGTLVSTPSDSKDVDAAFMVVLGVDRPVSECTADNHFKGCIVQRRLIHYVKHTPLNLPITLWLVCKDIECGPDTTCARSGKCVSARITDPASCAAGPCFIEGDGPFVPGADGGPDGPVGDGGVDGPKLDADADVIVVDPPPLADRLYCPNFPNNCDLGTTCCFSHSGSGGRCSPPVVCDPIGDIVMKCNRRSDCAQGTDYCCGTVVNMGGVSLPLHGGGAGAGPEAGLPDAAVPDAATPDASIGTRTLTSTQCQTAPSACPAWICTKPTDCPPGFNTCDKSSMLFLPTGAFGECKP